MNDTRPLRDFEFSTEVVLDQGIDRIQRLCILPTRRTILDVHSGETAFFFDVINNADIWYNFPGTTSLIQTDRKPAFHVNEGYGLDRDLRAPKIVHLRVKNNRREAHLTWSSGDMLARFSGEVPVSVSRGSDGIYNITPQSDLEPGEYLLCFGHAGEKYDFSVR